MPLVPPVMRARLVTRSRHLIRRWRPQSAAHGQTVANRFKTNSFGVGLVSTAGRRLSSEHRRFADLGAARCAAR